MPSTSARSTPSSFAGGCACGAVRYQCSAAPLAMLNCHCRDCQRASGGGSSSVLAVPARALVLVKGEPRYFSTTGEAGFTARRGFCAACGSPLLADSSRMPQLIMLRAASLDDPSWFRPALDVWTASAQPWECLDPATRKHPREPPGPR